MPAMALRRRTRKTPDQAIKPESVRETVRKTDSTPQLVATAKFLRGLIPGDQSRRPDLPEPMERLMAEMQPKGPSTLNEIGKGAMQAWQALTDAQKRRRGAEVAILFTDLVGCSGQRLHAVRPGGAGRAARHLEDRGGVPPAHAAGRRAPRHAAPGEGGLP